MVTLALLVLWQMVRFIPLPVLDWRALSEFTLQYRMGFLPTLLHFFSPKTSVLSLGYEPYLLAHLALFWWVMCVPSLRKMGFRDRRSLDFQVFGLSFLLALVLGVDKLSWCANLISPTGQRIVATYFQGHSMVYRGIGLCALLAGLAFTLFILRLIRRHGLPFPLTCMVAWTVLLPVVTGLLSFSSDELKAGDSRGTIRFAILVGAGLVGGLCLLGAFWLYTDGGPQPGDERSRQRCGILPRLGTAEPSFLVFGLLSCGIFTWLWRAALRLLPLLGEGGRTVAERLVLPKIEGPLAPWALSHGVALGLALASALVFHRLFYNPDLRERLGGKLQSPLASFRGACWRALGIWCLFYALVSAGGFLRSAFFPSYPLLQSLATPYPWEVVFLLLAGAGFVSYARNLRLGFVAPVYAHGYSEPLYAVKALLGENGIPSVFGGDPYALLHGIIVGPVGRKELLVRESDRGRAIELLDVAGVTKRRSVAAAGEAPEGPAPESPSPA